MCVSVFWALLKLSLCNLKRRAQNLVLSKSIVFIRELDLLIFGKEKQYFSSVDGVSSLKW